MRWLFVFFSILLVPFTSQAELVEVNNTQFYVNTVGRGIPIIVLHGGPGMDHGYLRPQLDELGMKNKVIYYDQRCCGHSTGNASTEPLTLDQYVDDLEALRKKLNIDRFVLLGHSFGGQLAMRYAIKYPQRLDAMILMSTSPASSEELETTFQSLNKRLVAHQEILDRIKESKPFRDHNPSTMEAYFMMIASAQVHEPGDAKKININFTADSARNFGIVNESLRADLFKQRFDLTPQLRQVNTPTLIIHGEDDFIPKSAVKKIQQAMPNAEYVEIVDAGHYPYAEKKEETLGEINRFLSNLGLVGYRER